MVGPILSVLEGLTKYRRIDLALPRNLCITIPIWHRYRVSCFFDIFDKRA